MNCLTNKKKTTPLDTSLVLNKDTIFQLPRPHLGQVAYAADTNETYIYGQDGWQLLPNDVKLEGQGLQMSLYDLNCSIMEQLPTITDFASAIELINNYKDATNNVFYMLYAKEISYFTLFNLVNMLYECESLGHGVIECLASVGAVKSIDLTENKDAIEIWVVTPEGKTTCLYLFPYDSGIVTVRG